MLVEVDAKEYFSYFVTDPNPFISSAFIQLNKKKTDKIIGLVSDKSTKELGLIAGMRNGILKSPFSAPFGGFHFRSEQVYSGEIDAFVSSLKEYIVSNSLGGIEVTLSPDLYSPSFNAKIISSLLRNNFVSSIPEITNWVNLDDFNYAFTKKNSREYFRQALRNELAFSLSQSLDDKNDVYMLIYENRARHNRPIYMSFEDLTDVSGIWPVDYFEVRTKESVLVASAIFYRSRPDICYAVFWGDNDIGRPLRAMDYLILNLWSHYKRLGYRWVDLGISSESGVPNEGLLRFKETHDAVSSLRFKFSWYSKVP